MLVTDPDGAQHDVAEPPEGKRIQWIKDMGEPWHVEYWDATPPKRLSEEEVYANRCRRCLGRGYVRYAAPAESTVYTQATWDEEETCSRCGGSGTR